MATTARINGKTKKMSISEKARLLTVQIIEGLPGVLAVSSGTEQHKGYQVTHNGAYTTGCNCGSFFPNCSHMVAGDLFLLEHPQERPQQQAQPEAPQEVQFSVVCGHRVRIDIYSDCGCQA